MADTTNKNQVNVLLTHEADDLLRALYDAKQKELGVSFTLGAYIEMLVKEEAKRQGIESKTGRKSKKA